MLRIVEASRERKHSATVRVLRKIFIAFCAITVPIIVSCVLFFIRTGQLPALSKSVRSSQIISSYFSTMRPVVVRSVNIRSTGTSAFLAFQKDPYFEVVFDLPDDLNEIFNAEELPYDNRLLIFEPIQLGIFTPIVEFVWPLMKTYEISIKSASETDENDMAFGVPRIWDSDAKDLDNDGLQELIIYWMDYGGGSSAAIYPIVLNFSDPRKVSSETFPFVIQEENSKRFALVCPKDYVFLINGKTANMQCMCYSSDCFWDFRNIDSDSAVELVLSIPQDDWEYHYGEQSWIISVFSYTGKRFIPEPDYSPFLIPKSFGLGLPEMHGYSFVPAYGQISFMWLPSWLELRSQDGGLTKARSQSIVWKLLKERHINQSQ